MRCKGPRAAGIQWDCDMEHGVVDGRCAQCQIMAEAGSNLSLKQIAAVGDAVYGLKKGGTVAATTVALSETRRRIADALGTHVANVTIKARGSDEWTVIDAKIAIDHDS